MYIGQQFRWLDLWASLNLLHSTSESDTDVPKKKKKKRTLAAAEYDSDEALTSSSDDEPVKRKRKQRKSKRTNQKDLFGASRGPRPSADGLATIINPKTI